jgi:hypothetical protein
VSRQSDAKKARRKKRKAAQDSTWIPGQVYEELVGADEEAEAIGEAVAHLDDWLTERGWVLDDDTTAILVSWVYPPSAVDVDDDSAEPVTRMWATVAENDEEVVLEFGALLVGSGADDEACVLDPANLAEDIAALEAYRPGLARPELR